jgi:hypothetical protein
VRRKKRGGSSDEEGGSSSGVFLFAQASHLEFDWTE